jgi:hypothetical protein
VVVGISFTRMPLAQKIISGLFGVPECIVVWYIAVKHVVASLSPLESQIQLPED